MTGKDAGMLNIWEKGSFEEGVRTSVDQGGWKTKMNQELKEVHETPVLVADIERKLYILHIFKINLKPLHIYEV
jgi:hypothetical protein